MAQWLPFLFICGTGLIGMAGYTAYLQRQVIQMSLTRVDEVSPSQKIDVNWMSRYASELVRLDFKSE